MPCSAVTKDGKPCSASVQRESDWCAFHDPERVEENRLARSAGGKRGRDSYLSDDAPLFTLRSASDVLLLVETTANAVLTGALDSKRGSVVAYLSSVALKAIETSELQERIDRIEEQMNS